jgi:cytochrome c553
MKGVVQELDKKAINNLSQYFSQLAPKGASQRVLEGPEILSKKCNRCHGDDGTNPDPEKPRIGGQKQSYLVNALKAYRKGDRIHSTMQAMTEDMWTVEIEAIAAYYAAQ